ncbi:MAG TPA: hypothetical protein VFI14_06530 [Chryseosolibacter sp.]|nr:hypothetical protein [Chryseosolibacter sp.]
MDLLTSLMKLLPTWMRFISMSALWFKPDFYGEEPQERRDSWLGSRNGSREEVFLHLRSLKARYLNAWKMKEDEVKYELSEQHSNNAKGEVSVDIGRN